MPISDRRNDNGGAQASLRDRKKAKTRRELSEAARRLFLRQGYEETTLDQIADEVEVSVQTVLRYFEAKPRLALAKYHDELDDFRNRLEDTARTQDAIACWREHVDKSARTTTNTENIKLWWRMVRDVPDLVAGSLRIRQEYEDAIANALAHDAGVDPESDLYGRLLATMLVGGNAVVVRQWIDGEIRGDLNEACLAVVDFALENFPERAPGVGIFS